MTQEPDPARACLDEDAILAYVEGRAQADEIARVRRHIDACEACRQVVAEVARSSLGRSSAEPNVAVRGERYTVLSVIGAGANGVVYAAYDQTLERKVALKLLVRDATQGDHLTQEARLMAQLSHPNVVHVYDAGSLGEQVYLSMELIDGETLARWQQGRDAREIVAAYIQAGRGLAEAHRAGLVHRDFKPENVLMGRDGVARVTDFGLAARGPDREAAIVGTPAYMAPEQLRGQGVDARTDQFSFCVALFEALHGQRPFVGSTLKELEAAVAAGRMQRGSARVPAHVQRVLERGLAAAPGERFASMDELLVALAADPQRTRRRLAATVALIALVGGGAALWVHHERAVCEGGPRRLRGIWDGSVRDALRAAFAKSGVSSPETVWTSVTSALDGYGRAWTDMHHEACEARLHGEQSAEALDLRMQCLDGRLSELRALTQLLGTADREAAQHAVDASHALPLVSLCADVKALMQPVRVPSDPAIRARIDAANARLADAQAAREAGRLSVASALASQLADEAAKIGYAPLDARAQLLLGGVRDASGDGAGAEQALYAALARADEGHDDRVRAHAWDDLLQIAASANRSADAARLDALANAAIARLGGDDTLEAGRLNALATLLYGQGKFAEASAQYERVLALRKHVYGADSPQTAGSEYKLGVLARGQGKFDDALVHLRAAQTLWEKLYGPDHPAVARTLSAMGVVYMNQHKYEEASAVLTDAVARGEQALGPKHPELASYLQNLAISYTLRNKFAQALPYLERVLTMVDEKQPTRMTAMASLAQAYVGVGRAKEAVPLLERAIAMRPEKEIPPRQLADMRFILATALWDAGADRARARVLAKQAYDVYVGAGAPYAATRDEIDAWMRKHP